MVVLVSPVIGVSQSGPWVSPVRNLSFSGIRNICCFGEPLLECPGVGSRSVKKKGSLVDGEKRIEFAGKRPVALLDFR